MVAKCHSLSRVGTVFHEVPLPGGRKPDISFTYPGENTVGFIADVTAISDEGLHNANPVQDLSQELVRLAHRVGLIQITFAMTFAASRRVLMVIRKQSFNCRRS